MKTLLLTILLMAGAVVAAVAPWSFVIIADNRSDQATFGNALNEIRDRTVNPAPLFEPAEFVMAAGDIDPVASNYQFYSQPQFSAPPFYPVVGNHEFETASDMAYILDSILPSARQITRRDTLGNYVLDWKNIRIIVIDQYSALGNASGNINSMGLAWCDSVISAAAAFDHVFICFHEPAFARGRHVGDSFDQFPADRDAFWNMLVSHANKVRAAFVGHTHVYSRMRVLNPATAGSNGFPDEPGGIYQFDAGAAGNGVRNTILRVRIDGTSVAYRAVDALDGAVQPFSLIDSVTQTAPVTSIRNGSVKGGLAYFLNAAPNPSRTRTVFTFAHPERAGVLSIHDPRGRIVARFNGPFSQAQIVWHNERMSSGVYIARLKVAGLVLEKKVLLIR